VKRALPLLAILAVSGCAPAFFADLNASTPLTRQMTFLGTIGPLLYRSNLQNGSIRFLPVKPTTSLGAASGFVIKTEGGFVDVSFAYLDTSGSTQEVTGVPGFSLAGSDPNYPLYDFDVAATTTTANLVVFALSPTQPTANQATLITATLPGGSITVPTTGSGNPQALTSVFGAVDTSLGVQVSPNVGGAADTVNFLVANGGLAVDGISSFGGVASVINSQSAPGSLPLSLPSGVNRFFYGKGGAFGYASYFQNGAWTCIQWPVATYVPVTLAGMTHRLDAVLTSGDLLSTDGGVLRLYDPSGNLLRSVALGGLEFCYEAYVGSVPYVFFSQALGNRNGNWIFNNYALPTSSMRSLGG
jgi:hypothetical protein